MANLAKADEFAKTFAGASIKSLVVEQASGSVSVVSTAGSTASVQGTKHRFDHSCAAAIDLVDGVLTIGNRAPKTLSPKQCQVDWVIQLPPSSAPRTYDFNVETGDLTLDRVRGILRFKVGAGKVSVAGATLSKFDGRSGSGDVSFGGAFDTADLKIGAGNADVSLTQAPTRGRLKLHVGTGNATVRLPKDTLVRSSFRAGMGSMTNEFSDRADAPFEVSAAAGTGDLAILKL